MHASFLARHDLVTQVHQRFEQSGFRRIDEVVRAAYLQDARRRRRV